MCWQKNNSSSTMKNLHNPVSQKENDNSPEARFKLKLMEYCNLRENSKQLSQKKKKNHRATRKLRNFVQG